VTAAARLRTRWLGRLAYDEAWDLQRAIWEGRTGASPSGVRTGDDYLLLVEHPHVYTVGRNGDGSNLLVDPDRLSALSATIHHVDRGGDITYHGPGQLVGYPIFEVPRFRSAGVPGGYDMVGHVRRIERLLIATLADFGIDARAEEGSTGVWTAQAKEAAIGVRVARGDSMHGFALNVDPDLDYFGHIVPCGITDRQVTSMRRLLDREVTLEEVVHALVPHVTVVFGPGAGWTAPPETQLAAFSRGSRKRAFDVDRMVAAGVFSPEARHEVPVTIRGLLNGEPERPEWMRVKADLSSEGYQDLKRLMRDLELNTVCEEAGCPNIYECWGQGTATLMLLGDRCTRACAFCDVTTGRPGEVDLDEPRRAAEAVEKMGLSHTVLTSVNRDDLADGGSAIFAETIRRIRDRLPGCDVEVLIPDFKGDRAPLETVMAERPDVLNHNTETVLRLQRDIRTAANYGRSLALLARAKWLAPAGTVKSGLIVGMGETEDEVLGALADLRTVGVDIVTIGQYARPTARHRPIDRYVHPDEFDRYRTEGEQLGLPHVESGPLVRSSYHAKDSLTAAAH
jgi:lipoic acid synthetase